MKVRTEGVETLYFETGPMLGSWSTDLQISTYEPIHLKLMNLSYFLFLTLKVSPKSKFKLLNFSPFWNVEYFPCHFTIWSNLIERNLLKFIFLIVSFIFTFPIVSLCLLFYHLVQIDWGKTSSPINIFPHSVLFSYISDKSLFHVYIYFLYKDSLKVQCTLDIQ